MKHAPGEHASRAVNLIWFIIGNIVLMLIWAITQITSFFFALVEWVGKKWADRRELRRVKKAMKRALKQHDLHLASSKRITDAVKRNQ